MTLFLVLVTGAYVILICSLAYGWRKIPVFKLMNREAVHKFSIVVPYRNEAENLPRLLASFLKMEYPFTHYEIILVNDDSDDDSRMICADFRNEHPYLRISLIENKRLTPAPKKDAITTAVNKAMFGHILTTDADCILPPFWLHAYNEILLDTDASLVAGPVSSRFRKTESGEANGKNYLFAFQEMDLMSLQAAGAGAFGLGEPFIANAANLCYSREAFLRLEGFKGNDEISSGDDVFLLQKFKNAGLKKEFLMSREAIVFTKPQPDLASLISQRIRWAAKTPAYKSLFAKVAGMIVLLMNLILMICAFLVLTDFIPYEPVLFAFLLKFVADFYLLFQATRFFRRKELLRNYFWSSLIYPFFSSGVAIMSLFKKFEWKGRTFSR